MEGNAWFKFVSLKFRWHRMTLEGIENVAGIKEAIRAMMNPMFDSCVSGELVIKATKIGEEDAGCPVVLDGGEDLESILRRFGVEDHRPSIQEAFAKNIRLFVASARSAITDRLTERQLLTLRPYSLTYTPRSRRGKKPQITTPSLGSTYAPRSVVGWEDFTREARLLALDDTTPCYDHPRFVHQKASGKSDIQFALNINVLDLLSDTIGFDQMPREKFCRHDGHERVHGEPAFLLVSGDRLVIAVEVKTKWELPACDIVEMYQENHKDLKEHRTASVPVINHIKEIYGYMGHNKLQFGVLSTYENTWFIRRPPDNPSKLFISEAVTNSAADPTLLQCFAYIMSLARRSLNSPFPPPAPPSPPTADCKPPSEKGDNASKRSQADIEGDSEAAGTVQPEPLPELEDFGWDGLKLLDVLGYGRSGTVYRAVLRGEEVAYKLCDLWKHPEYEKKLLNEGKIYTLLKELQGRSIPKLKGIGYTAGGFMVIATEIAGSPILAKELSVQERDEIIAVLSEIHDCGILHKDIGPQNILIHRHGDAFKVMFIDFSASREFSEKKEARREMDKLLTLLG